jgi:hypothetical protein
MVFTYIKTEQDMKETGSTIKKMDMVSKYGQMELIIKESSKKIKNMEEVK